MVGAPETIWRIVSGLQSGYKSRVYENDFWNYLFETCCLEQAFNVPAYNFRIVTLFRTFRSRVFVYEKIVVSDVYAVNIAFFGRTFVSKKN